MLILLNDYDKSKKEYHLYNSIKSIIDNQKECYILINTVEEYDIIVEILEYLDIKWRSGQRATYFESYKKQVNTDSGSFFIAVNFSKNKFYLTQGINPSHFFQRSNHTIIINNEEYWDEIDSKKRGDKLDNTSETKSF